MVKKNLWLSMRHFLTKEYANGVFMGQQQCEICNTNMVTNGWFEGLTECTIYASTLTRSKQTVDYVISKFSNINFKVFFSDNLIERGLGDFEGKRKCDLINDQEFFLDGKFIVQKTPPNGESISDFRVRVNEEVNRILCENKHRNVLVISHLQVLRMIRFCQNGNFDYSQWHKINYLHGEVVRECYGKKQE